MHDAHNKQMQRRGKIEYIFRYTVAKKGMNENDRKRNLHLNDLLNFPLQRIARKWAELFPSAQRWKWIYVLCLKTAARLTFHTVQRKWWWNIFPICRRHANRRRTKRFHLYSDSLTRAAKRTLCMRLAPLAIIACEMQIQRPSRANKKTFSTFSMCI